MKLGILQKIYISSKTAAIHEHPSSIEKVASRSFIGALNFYTIFNEKLHINFKPCYDLSHENTPSDWTQGHERLSNQ